jgi:hypothetical protein
MSDQGRSEIGPHKGPSKYTDKQIAEALASCLADVGRPPSQAQYVAWARRRGGNHPSPKTITLALGKGSWLKALKRVRGNRGGA